MSETLRFAEMQAQLPGTSAEMLTRSTWMADAGPLGLLIELRDREGGRHAFAELSTRAVAHEFGGAIVRLAAFDDIAASKALADRPKDREALPELGSSNAPAGDS